MQPVRIVIGRFRRHAFAESLAATLTRYPELAVESAADVPTLREALGSVRPTVIILDADSDDDPGTLRPATTAVAVLLLSAEGRDASLLLHQIDAGRIRTLADAVRRSAAFRLMQTVARHVLRLLCTTALRRHPKRAALATGSIR